MKVVEGWAIAIENGHIEVGEGLHRASRRELAILEVLEGRAVALTKRSWGWWGGHVKLGEGMDAGK
mgnify:CR=1 FL=1